MYRTLWLTGWILLFLAIPGFAAEEGGREYLRTRNRGNCAILVASPNPETGRVDDTTGLKVAPLDLKKLQEFLEKKPKLEGVMLLTGVPMWGREKREFVAKAREMLREYGFPQVPIKVFREPTSRGPMRVIEELRYFLMMGSDIQAPVASEMASSLVVAGVSNVSLAIFSFAKFDAHIAIPMVATNSTLDFAAAFYRRSISNWINRSTGLPVSGGQKFLKECMIGSIFAAGMYASNRIDGIAGAFRESGLARLLCEAPAAAATFAADQAPTIAANGLLFTLLFNGLYSWDQMRSTTPEGDLQVRRTSPWILSTLFAAMAPAFALATTSHRTIVDIPYIASLNLGHLLLFAGAGAGLMFWARPQLFDYAVPIVEKGVYVPLRFLKRIFGLGRAAVPPEGSAPPEGAVTSVNRSSEP